MKFTLALSLLALAPMARGHIGHATPPAGKVVTSEAMTGNGEFRFLTVPGWGAMPDGVNVGPTHGGVAVDSAGHVYVSTEAEHAVVVFSKDGKFVKSIAPECSGLHSLMIAKEGDKEVLWGAHVGSNRVVKLDLDGNILFQIPNENTGEIPGGWGGTTAVTPGPDGRIYVACGYGSSMVHMFDATGKLLKSMGGKGAGDGKFMTCHGIAIDTRKKDEPRLLVCDRENRRLVHLDLDLNWLSVHSTGLRRPCAVSFNGENCAVAELAGRVTILDGNGVPVAFLGDQPDRKLRAQKPIPEDQLYDGLFTSPHGLSYDGDGNLIVQDWNVTGRVTALKHVTE